MAQAFGLPMSNKAKETAHIINGTTVKVKNRFWHGAFVGYNCFIINEERIFVNVLERQEAAEHAYKKYALRNIQKMATGEGIKPADTPVNAAPRRPRLTEIHGETVDKIREELHALSAWMITEFDPNTGILTCINHKWERKEFLVKLFPPVY
jgi:hypothetical protein